MEVRYYMTRNPLTVVPDDSLRKAQLLMRQGRLHHLPVVEGVRVVGILTDRDIWQRCPSGVFDGGADAAADLMDYLRVMGVMTLQPVTIAPDTAIARAARLLREKNVGALLVVENSELLGIITEGDIIDALITSAPDAISAPQS